MNITNLPSDLLAIVFDNLDAATCRRVRGVCREWRHGSAASGCVYLETVHKKNFVQEEMHQVRLYGQWTMAEKQNWASCHDGEEEEEDNGGTPKSNGKKIYATDRVKGHLPQPQVMLEDDDDEDTPTTLEYTSESPLHSVPAKYGVAMRMEYGSPATQMNTTFPKLCKSMDVSHAQSTYEMTLVVSGPGGTRSSSSSSSSTHPPPPTPQIPLSLPTPRRPLKKILKEIDLSGLVHLERLSVRGCSNLLVLRLPRYGLKALDASSCSSLRYIYTVPSPSHPPRTTTTNNNDTILDDNPMLQQTMALSLNGCRSLVSHQGGLFNTTTPSPHNNSSQQPQQPQMQSSNNHYWMHTRQMDLTSICQMSKVSIATCLRQTMKLMSLSLRYVATDEILEALASSKSCGYACEKGNKNHSTNFGTLRFVDVAFSPQLTDSSVKALVQRASLLERINLRGCKSISGLCYNEVPIELAHRRCGIGTGHNDTRPPQASCASSSWTTRIHDHTMSTTKKRKGDNIFHLIATTTTTHPKSTPT